MNLSPNRAGLIAGLLFNAALACSAQTAPPASSSPAQPAAAAAQDSTTDANEHKARALLDAMVTALGGQRWLTLTNVHLEGRTSGFYQGKPTGAVEDYFDTRELPDKERIEYTKKHDTATLFVGKEAWDITYRGKQPVPAEQANDYFRRREHSIDVAIRVWLKDPGTVLVYEGQTMAERHLADQVTLLSADNDAIKLQLDADTHLPLRRSFQWRDPLYKDKNEELEEYDDYHLIDGIQTPFTVTRFHNGDMSNQRFLYRAAYNIPLAPDFFNADALAAHLKR